MTFHTPPAQPGDRAAAANTLGLCHLPFVIDDIDEVLEPAARRSSAR